MDALGDCPQISVDFAVESEAGAILSILAETFPHEILERTPLGCTGARPFIADTIGRRHRGCDVIWLVARDSGVIGFVEMRVGPQELFLNHIHVSPSRQSQGLGRLLLRRSIELTRPPGASRIGLSVFQDRARQIQWYQRLSFAEVRTSRWLTTKLKRTSPPEWFCVSELPGADWMHARYGFSQLGLRTLTGAYKIGRLGDRFYRTQDAAILEDPAALGALRALGPRRELVITSLEGEGRVANGLQETHSVTALHMSARIEAVLAHLTEEKNRRCARN